MIGNVLAVVAALAALAILGKRLWDFVRTGGESACRNCPYSGSCRGQSACRARGARGKDRTRRT